jgi:hypothetical protein
VWESYPYTHAGGTLPFSAAASNTRLIKKITQHGAEHIVVVPDKLQSMLYWDDNGKRRDVTYKDISKALKLARRVEFRSNE